MVKEAIERNRYTGIIKVIMALSLFRVIATAATKTATVSVVNTVQSSCSAGTTVSGTTSFGTLNFGTYSSLGQAITAVGVQNAGAIQVQCPPGTSYKIVMSSGSGSSSVSTRYMVNGSNKISYNLYTDSTFQTVWDNVTGVSRTATGQQEWVPVYGLVSSQATPVAGTYTDSVQVTVSW